MNRIFFLATLLSITVLTSCDVKTPEEPINSGNLEEEIKYELNVNILDRWYPIIIDTTDGGYLSNLSSTFDPSEKQEKMIVTQSRHMWTTAMVAKRESNATYLKYAAHGLPFLKKMWDTEFGGFYQNVDRLGNPLDGTKTAYGNAFAIYGLSTYFDASGDTVALNLAKKTFLWLEDNCHDPELGGYFQDLNRQGDVIQRTDSTPSTSTVGYKDQNSSIHLLEAFTSLYKVWPDPLVKERLSEMYFLVKDVMFNDDHYLNLFFTADLKPVSFYEQDSATILEHAGIDHVSFGHDIETAYLLLEASEALGIHHDQKLLDELKQIVDHALLGIDPANGGLYDQGYYFEREDPLVIIKDSKAWWAQAEALNTLLIFHGFYPDAGYDKQFTTMWDYIKTNLIDHKNGGWYIDGIDTRPHAKEAPKASIWKSTYHNYRALANIMEILNKEK